jgi:hypothetical protein
MNRVRLGAVLSATVVTLAGSFADAAPAQKPQVTDPAGDALLPGFDIVSAKLSTTGNHGVEKVGGRTVKWYVPKNLVASVTLSGPPSTTPGSSVQLWIDTTACNNGRFQFYYTPGALLDNVADAGDLYTSGCGPASTTNDSGSQYVAGVHAMVKGNTITWVLPLKALGPELSTATKFSNFRVYADLDDPLIGQLGTQTLGQGFGAGDVDFASSATTWKLG